MIIKNLFLPKFPKSAGTAKEFRDWDIHLKETYPTRYKIAKIAETIYHKIILFPMWRIRDFKWKMLHTYHPKYQYHVFRSKRLQPDYYNIETRMLFFNFEMFERFMDRILRGESDVLWDYSDCEVDEQHGMSQTLIDEKQARWVEMNELYTWWTETRPNRKELEFPKLPEEWGMLAVVNEDFENEPRILEWKAISKLYHEQETNWLQEDDEMLIRLIKLRHDLWD